MEMWIINSMNQIFTGVVQSEFNLFINLIKHSPTNSGGQSFSFAHRETRPVLYSAKMSSSFDST